MISYTTLTATKTTAGSIANWVSRSDLPTADILTEAEAMIYQDLRVEDMLTRTTLTLALAATSAALPSDYLGLRSFTPYGWEAPMLYVPPEKMVEQVDDEGTFASGTPTMFMVMGGTAYFDLATDEAITGRLLYYARPAALSVSNETNFLTIKYPTLLRYAILHLAYEHMKDQAQGQEYLAKFMAQLAKVKVADDLNKMGQWVPAG